jgi:pimeloyl-ACP methyl ester carboxylesterase
MVTKSFQFEENKLVYDEYGKGAKVVVLLPGLLFSRQMHRPLAEALEERGHRVLCLDFLGHGDSDRPPEMWNYGVSIFGRQSIALLDHAGVDKAVIGGTSLGANATLEAAAAAPDRVRGMLIEMPVLDNALLGCALAFTPLLVGLTFGAPFARHWRRLQPSIRPRRPRFGRNRL